MRQPKLPCVHWPAVFSAELLDRKIRVNTLTPGPVDTPVFASVTGSAEEAQAMKEAMGNFTPVKRVAHAEELAAAALYLASGRLCLYVGCRAVAGWRAPGALIFLASAD